VIYPGWWQKRPPLGESISNLNCPKTQVPNGFACDSEHAYRLFIEENNLKEKNQCGIGSGIGYPRNIISLVKQVHNIRKFEFHGNSLFRLKNPFGNPINPCPRIRSRATDMSRRSPHGRGPRTLPLAGQQSTYLETIRGVKMLLTAKELFCILVYGRVHSYRSSRVLIIFP